MHQDCEQRATELEEMYFLLKPTERAGMNCGILIRCCRMTIGHVSLNLENSPKRTQLKTLF